MDQTAQNNNQIPVTSAGGDVGNDQTVVQPQSQQQQGQTTTVQQNQVGVQPQTPVQQQVNQNQVQPVQTPPQAPQQSQAQSQVAQLPAQPAQPTQPVSVSAERAEMARPSESVPLVELKEDHELEPEVEGWLEHLKQDKEIHLPDPVMDGKDVVMANASAQVIEEKLVLPMSQSGVQTGMKAKVNDSARWLAEWCTRVIKMFGDKVAYNKAVKEEK